MLEPGSFDACKNVTIPMIAMLDHSEVDTEISNIYIKTMESNDCKEVLENDRDANGVWPQYEREQDFSAKMNGSLLTYLPS